MRHQLIAIAGMLLISTGCAATAATGGQPGAARCAGTLDDNRRVVLAFYEEGLVGLNPRAAFLRYMTPDFVEHKADVPHGTREATVAYLEALIASVPAPHWEVVRTMAEGDLVFVHARFAPAEGAPAYAIADIFRLRDCLIVEHWDVVAAPPAEQRNPNPRF